MKNVLLIGLGNFGSLIAQYLNEMGHEVMAVDQDEERVNKVMPYVTNALIGDSTDVTFLESLGVNNFDLCLVTISGDFQSSLETTSLLKELGGTFVVARAERSIQEKFLLRNGADAVVYPEKQLAKWTCLRYTSEHILSYLEIDEDYGIYDVTVPEEWRGKSILELDIRRKHGMTILGVKKDGKMSMNVSPDTILTADDTLLILADEKSMKIFV